MKTRGAETGTRLRAIVGGTDESVKQVLVHVLTVAKSLQPLKFISSYSDIRTNSYAKLRSERLRQPVEILKFAIDGLFGTT